MTNAFNTQINQLDLSLFDAIPSESSDGDRRAWLAIQRSIRRPSGYAYLEIGSHLGGSIQQHIIDPWCISIVSIDKRPVCVRDDRGPVYTYEGNSTARMLANLATVAPNSLDKLLCFDSDARDVDPHRIAHPPDFCFIDGEHTHSAVLSDFQFCLSVCSPDAAICFHDDHVIWKALRLILADLRRRKIPFVARKLEGAVFAIFLRACPAATDPFINSFSSRARGFLFGQILRSFVPPKLKPAARWLYRNSMGKATNPR
jgi:hypothetical protein